jgi:hypothetical protein
MLIIPQTAWANHLDDYSPDERYAIHLAQTGQSVDPRGFVIDESQLSDELRAKVAGHFVVRAMRAGRGAEL